MNAKTKKNLLIGGAALGAYVLYRNSSLGSSVSSSDPNSGGALDFLSSIASTVTDTVSELTGNLQEDFVTLMTPIATQIESQSGISPLITITQAAHESGWGKSGLTKKANNLYGYTGTAQLSAWLTAKELPANTSMNDIRAMDLSAAPFIILQTHEEVSNAPHQYFERPGDLISQDGTDALVYRPFRRYDSWASSVADWVQLLHGTRYANALADAQRGDMVAFAHDIWAAGYATDSTYPAQLVRVAGEVSDIQNA